MIRSIRARLTLWYAVVVALVLIAFSAIAYGLLARAIRSSTDAAIQATAREFSSAFSRGDGAADIALDLRYSDREIFVFGSNGQLVASPSSRFTRDERRRIAEAARTGAGFVTVAGGPEGDGIRLYREPITVFGATFSVVVAQDLDPQADRLESAAHAVLLGIPVALIIACGGGYLLARKALAPVAAISTKAREISAATLSERLVVPNADDELGHLAATFNDLLQRLEVAFESQRRFMADASHELRTPVSIVLGEADVILSRPERARTEYRESLRIIQKSALKLTRIIQNIFLLARSDAGTLPIGSNRFYLDELVSECVTQMRTMAVAKNVTIKYQTQPDLIFEGDEELVEQLLHNLIENALRFTPEHGNVVVSAAEEGSSSYVIRVADTGRGIPVADQPFIFDRFFRGQHGTTTSGGGLGLAIARWIAEAHGGSVELQESSPQGTIVRVTFPRAASEPSALGRHA